jgi:DNA helicase II / ATP-dependent DNA helicase PcrA
MQTNKQLDKFKTIYNQLNSQQQKAVDAITGVIMVIAGPGTGKTQILSARIGKILLETDTLPQNILCLTYTDAGTFAMRKRLLEFIGPEAYKVNIHTFHSFCNDVIQDNLDLFNKRALNPISDLEEVALYKELINNFKKDNPLKRYRGDVYYEIFNLKSLFNAIKKEGWTKDFLLEKIETYCNNLPFEEDYIYKKAYKGFKAGDVKQHLIDEELAKMEKLKAAVNEYENYMQLMNNKNLYDFNDMINWVIAAFEKYPHILEEYSSKFNHILVDEYQDTSGTQNKIIELLFEPNYTESIFVVGDDDQSIYRFQGANVENMLGFATTYLQQLETIVLIENYRSVQPILDVSKSIIDKNFQRLINKIPNLSKNIVTANKNLIGLTNQPEIYECNVEDEEMMIITKKVKSLLIDGVSPNQIAIIYRENKYGDALANYLHHLQIPFYSKRQINILQEPLINQIVLMLNFLVSEHDVPYEGDEMLFEILHFNFWKIKPIDIAKLSVEAASKRYDDEKTSIRSLLYLKANEVPKDLFSSNAISNELKNASQILEQLIADVSNCTIQTVLENIISNTGILAQIMQGDKKYFDLKLLTAFFNFVKDETARNPALTLKELVSILEMMMDENLALPLVDIIGNEKSVNLLTVHGSKGLEFDHVFIAGTVAHVWEKKRKGNKGYKLPNNIFQTSSQLNADEENEEELRRLFYVALTRAAKHVYISYYNAKSDGKLAEPSMFIAEIIDRFNIPVQLKTITQDEKNEFVLAQFSSNAQPQLAQVEEDFVNRIVEKFVMNVTALNNYLKCPLQFYYNNIIRVPSGRNEAMEFGSAVHHALDMLFKKMQQNNNQFPSKAEFIADYNWYLKRHRENFTKEQFDRRQEYGHEILSNYYDKYISTFNKIVTTEKNIRNVVDNIPIRGKLDKLEFDGTNVNVVDYKTGDYEKAKKTKKTFDTPNEKNPNGGDYWRQAVFYKILIDNNTSNPSWKVLSTEFDFIEPNAKKEFVKEKINISDADITTVKEQIKSTWAKIQNKEFYTGCGKEDCRWCNFVKTYNIAETYIEPEEETDENNLIESATV